MSHQSFWSIFAPHLQEFIHLKRSLGYKYNVQEQVLLMFDRFVLDQAHTQPGLTQPLAERWAEKRYNESDLTKYGKVLVVRQFAEHLRTCGVPTYIPNLPPYPQGTFIPYIFTHEEMSAMFRACDELRAQQRNMESCLLIMPCLLRMLYGTGMRISEALFLKNKDVDTTGKCLILRDTKNGTDRVVPISSSLALVCRDYLDHRERLPVPGLNGASNPFFVTLNGRSCKQDAVYRWFRKVLSHAGIPFTGNRKGPRVHDIRHTYACHCFVKLAEEGVDLYCSWPYLSTYLGHQSLEATEQYIRLTAQMYPDLLTQTDGVHVDVLPNITFKTT